MRPSPRPLVALLILFLAAACAGTGAPGVQRDMASAEAVLDRAAAARLVSSYRLRNARAALTRDDRLDRIAQDHADAMARAGRMSHSLNGRDFRGRLDASGYRVLRAYENIGAGHRNFAHVFERWSQSASHRDNMLKRGVSRIGIGHSYAPDDRHPVYWVLIVAEPYAPPAGAGGFRWGPPAPAGLGQLFGG